MIEKLEELGVITLDEIPEKLVGICIIRTHGATPQTILELESKGCKIVDATCPDVKHAQEKATTLAKEGYQVIVIGKADHPEVIAIKANADLNVKNSAVVLSSEDEAIDFVNKNKPLKKIGIVVQTTQKIENFKRILSIIAENTKELKVYNTICPATCKRQTEAVELARRVELMIVVGSKSSANTTHLAEILSKITETVHIETYKELDAFGDQIRNANKIGVTAGASTPEFVINDVVNKISKKGEKQSD